MLNIPQLFPHASADLRSALEAAPKKLLEVNAKIDYKDALQVDDIRYVDTNLARAEKFQQKFYRSFGYNPKTGEFQPFKKQHTLFFGHVGCGKSTELTQLCQKLHHKQRYWVLRVDLLELLDPANVNYSDVWLAVAKELMVALEKQDIKIDDIYISRLEKWFSEQVFSHDQLKDFVAEVKTQAEATSGIPFIGKWLAQFTASFKTGSTYRETVRTVVRNTYGEFVGALNAILANAQEKIQQQNKGQAILIVIDGTDRFRGADWRSFFVDDANQLLMVDCVVIYTAPLALKSSGARVDLFESIVLPMIKLKDFGTQHKRPEAYDAMRQVLLKRCHYSLFDTLDTLDTLIEYSGGHLRDALRLLAYACVEADDSYLTQNDVEVAAKRLASDYRDWLEESHYPVLVAADKQPENMGRTDIITKLVEGGALLEYNTGSWRQSHPVIKLLQGYKKAETAYTPI